MTIFLVIVSYLITVMIVQALRQLATTCTFTVFSHCKDGMPTNRIVELGSREVSFDG
jgi:hypothetical protein